MGSICAITKLPCTASELTVSACSEDAGIHDVAACATKLIEMNIELKNDIAELEDYIEFLKNREDVIVLII